MHVSFPEVNKGIGQSSLFFAPILVKQGRPIDLTSVVNVDKWCVKFSECTLVLGPRRCQKTEVAVALHTILRADFGESDFI